MARARFTPLVLSALALSACADEAGPLDPGPALSRATALPAADTDLHLAGVQLRPGVTADLHLRVFVDEGRRGACTSNQAVLAVPGFAHTAATWEPYAEALFDTPQARTCAVFALDFPGHGGSGLPEGISFGELTLDDYATALVAVIDRLADSGHAPATLIGHSQGGLVIQMAQQALVDAGSSLREAGGIREVELLAPVPAAPVSWAFTAVAPHVLTPLLNFTDPVLGPHASIPDGFWPVLFFSNLSGELAPGAPGAVEVAGSGYNAPAPLYASLQLIGAAPFARPSVDAGIFGGRNGTRLAITTFEQDQLIRPEESRALLAHLTGGRNGRKLRLIEGQFAVHDLHVSDPLRLSPGRGRGAPPSGR